MIVAGLDVASTTGVCIGEIGQIPEFHSKILGARGSSHDSRFAEALKLARWLINDNGVEAVGIEAPIIVPRRDNKSTNELLMGMNANIRGWCYIKAVRCQSFEIAFIDKLFIGARQKGRAERKAAIQHRCKMLGWSPKTDDEADAGSVFFVMCAEIDPDFAINNSPLFGTARMKKT